MHYTIQSDALRIQISSLGGELMSIQDDAGREYLWQGDPQYWADRAPNIFPYVGRLYNGTYSYKGRKYTLPIHGFVKDTEMMTIKRNDDTLLLGCFADEKTRAQYPFDFAYYIHYSVEDSTLVVSYIVENKGQESMYFGLGGHPGFNLPLEERLDFEDYHLAFDTVSRPSRISFGKSVLRDGNDSPYSLLNGRYIPLKHSLFDADAVILSGISPSIRLESEKGERFIAVEYPQMPFLGIWHMPNMDAPYVCIEPWTSLPGREGIVEDIAKQEDLIALDGGKRYENTWSIIFG